MIRFWCRTLLLTIAVILPVASASADAVIDRAEAAAAAGRWEEAIAIYNARLFRDPDRTDLWVRLADIYAAQQRHADEIEALEQAARSAPDDGSLQFRLAQVYRDNQKPKLALDACLQALKLAPHDTEILRTCAETAEWAGDLEASRSAFEELLRREPGNARAMLGLARARGWAGALDESASYYGQYIEKLGENETVLLEASRVEAWRGNFAVALAGLDRYRAQFGETEPYARDRARVLAWADRPRAAAEINDPLLAAHLDDYEINFTNTVILARGNRPREALASLDELVRLRPDASETLDIARVVRTPNRSHLAFEAHYYNDSDEIRIDRASLEWSQVINPETRLVARVDDRELRADLGTGFATFDGKPRIDDRTYWIGIQQRLTPSLQVDARVGRAEIDGDDRFTAHSLGVDIKARDDLGFALEHSRELHAVSPRAVSLGVKRKGITLRASWQPDLVYTVDAEVSYDEFSDGNRRRRAVLGPRKSVLRREDFNLDLGVSLEWFSFDDDLNNGYYDPDSYRRYAFTAFGYWKLNADDGVSLSASLGWHKDDAQSDYELGGDIGLEGLFGIYRDWYLRLRLDYSDRTQEVGSFDGFAARIGITRRF